MAGPPGIHAAPCADACVLIDAGRTRGFRIRRRTSAVLIGLLLMSSLTGCACRPGYVGPYGGVHPARCVIW